jgi:hypothetical protein
MCKGGNVRACVRASQRALDALLACFAGVSGGERETRSREHEACQT